MARSMPRLLVLGLLAAGVVLGRSQFSNAADKGVQVVADEAHRRVDITIDGKSFTSYIWPTSLKKPVLYPLITEDGVTVTRGYPLDPRPGERVDHPHHAGMWFNYGNVNGFDFWNNSDAIKPENRSKMGSIYQEKILSARSGPYRGELTVESEWITGTNQKILDETTRYVFTKRGRRSIMWSSTTIKKDSLASVLQAGSNPPQKKGAFSPMQMERPPKWQMQVLQALAEFI